MLHMFQCSYLHNFVLRYKGGPALPRKVIPVGVNKKLVVEVYPLCLELIDSRDKSRSIIRMSKKVLLPPVIHF